MRKHENEHVQRLRCLCRVSLTVGRVGTSTGAGVSRHGEGRGVQRVAFVYSQHFIHDCPTLSYSNPTYNRTAL